MKRIICLGWTLIFALLTPLPLSAEEAPPAPSKAAPPSQQVEKTWGDWSKICSAREDATRVCQIVQSANQNESGALVFQTAVGYVENNDSPIMYLTAPLGIFLPRGISIIVEERPPVTATVQRCDGNGCLGLIAMDTDFVDALKKGNNARIVFAANAQQNVALPLSLKGFTAAFNGLR